MIQSLINTLRLIFHTILPQNKLGDKIYSFLNFIVNHHGRFPRNRMLFNDYMYKLKISDEITNPLRVFITDKEFAKIYIRSVIGDEFNVPTFKILETYEEVLSYKFPSECVIKPTHMSGSIIIKKEKDDVDLKKIKKWFSMNYYNRAREANYKTLIPKIIVEPIIFNDTNITDYRFFCYKGIPKLAEIDHDRFNNRSKSYYKLNLPDADWTKQDFFRIRLNEKNVEKPKNLDTILKLLSILSKKFIFIRIDLYCNNNSIFIGELTSICGNASRKFYPATGEKSCSKIIFK